MPNTDEWRASVERRLDALDASVKAVQGGMDANTVLTAEVNQKVIALGARVLPVTDAVESMKKGIVAIGRVGGFFERLTRVAIWGLAGFLFFKIFFTTGSMEEAVAAFWRAIAK